jgi:hypothetical protein
MNKKNTASMRARPPRILVDCTDVANDDVAHTESPRTLRDMLRLKEEVCPVCGKRFETKNTRHECCSDKCRLKWWRVRQRSPITLMRCARCKKEVCRTKGRGYQRFCSLDCRKKWGTKQKSLAREYKKRRKWCVKRIAARLQVSDETVRRWVGMEQPSD